MSILSRYPKDGLRARLHRRLRLRFGGYRDLAEHLPARGRIVDLGCGWGLFAHVLVEASSERRVVAVDHAAHRVAALRASASGLPIEVHEAALESFELPPVDGIVLLDVLHYFDEMTQGEILVRCLRALHPGGVLLLRDPDPSAWFRFRLTRLHERIATGFGWTKAKLGHFRSGWQWQEVLEGYDLRVRCLPLSPFSPYADRVVVAVRP